MVTFSEGKANIELLSSSSSSSSLPLYSREYKKKRKGERETERFILASVSSSLDRKSRAAIFHNPHRGLIIARRKASG